MKLIIDIPENWEEQIKGMSDNEIANSLYGICRNGIPLEDITAEIDSLTYYWCEIHPRTVIDDVLKIINKHIGKGEV